MPKAAIAHAATGAGLLAFFLLAGCVSQQSETQNTEQMLVAAGFLEKPADTPKRQARLAALPPFRVVSQHITAGGQDTVGYAYADPKFCRCVYVGNPEAYQRFQQEALQQRIAQEQIAAADMAEEDRFGWDDWGPYPFWGGGPVVVFRGGGFHR
jgi:hypothetical protein